MPSVSRKQAHLMSAIAHGWKPDMKHAPSRAVAEEFHEADKREGRFEHPMAAGGGVSPLESAIQSGAPYLGRSSGPRNTGLPMARARMRMPYIPIADSMRNIDKSIIKSKNTLGKMKSAMPKAVTAGVRTKFASGGMVDPEAANAVQGALQHIKGGDFGSASATLRSSKGAMRYPSVARAAEHLRSADGLSPASQELQRFMKFMSTGQVTGEEGG